MPCDQLPSTLLPSWWSVCQNKLFFPDICHSGETSTGTLLCLQGNGKELRLYPCYKSEIRLHRLLRVGLASVVESQSFGIAEMVLNTVLLPGDLFLLKDMCLEKSIGYSKHGRSGQSTK